MASANVTLGGHTAREFEVDATERTATLQRAGGLLTNRGVNSLVIWVNENAGTVETTNGNESSVAIGAGGSHRLPATCRSFTFKASGSEFLKYTLE